MAIKIDCDSHFLPKDLFDDVDPQFGDRRPRLWFDAAGRDAITYPDREAALSKLSYHQRYGLMNSFIFHHHPPGFWEPEPRIEFLDRYGIRMQVLVPAPTPYHYDVEPDLRVSASLTTTRSPGYFGNILGASSALPSCRCRVLSERFKNSTGLSPNSTCRRQCYSRTSTGVISMNPSSGLFTDVWRSWVCLLSYTRAVLATSWESRD